MDKHVFINLFTGLKVKWKPTNSTGTILEFCVDVYNPERSGIEVSVRWDDNVEMRYNATDFSINGDIEILND